MSVRVRFPPSPTGSLHVGGARTALFNWLFARKHGGVLVLRVEDTDRERSSPESTQVILDGMTWLGLDWDEGPFFQSQGLERHRQDAARLVSEGAAYRDFTTPEQAAEDRERKSRGEVRRPERARAEEVGWEAAEERAGGGEPHAVRLRVPDGVTEWTDLVKGPLRFENAEMEDLVILRSDRTPTYNFAVVSDDASMAITHVIRGDDHVSNTPKQILIYHALGAPLPEFAHVPMILGADGKRLSKRHGATAVADYATQGILPDAMVNFLALLGWSPGDDTEVMERDELVRRFSLDRVVQKSAVFDPKKLEWLNGQYIQASDPGALEPLVTEELARTHDLTEYDADRLRELLPLLQPRSRTIVDVARQAVPFLVTDVTFDEAVAAKHWRDRPASAGLLQELRELFAESAWDTDALEADLRGFAAEREVGLGKVIHPLRLALTGLGSSPGIFDVLAVLGRETTLSRIDRAARVLEAGIS